MIAALLLAFREGLEAALILGIVLGILRRVGRPEQAQVVWLGTGLAGLVSVVIGLVLHALDVAFEGTAEEVLEWQSLPDRGASLCRLLAVRVTCPIMAAPAGSQAPWASRSREAVNGHWT